MRFKTNIISQLVKLPVICVLCSQYHRGEFAVCNECIDLFVPLGPACQYCALPLPNEHFPICGRCCLKKPDIDQVFTAYRFEEPLRTLLHDFKYRKGLYLSNLMTALVIKAIPTDQIIPSNCLIPVPMHNKRIRQRGFNQAAILARSLSRQCKIPYDLNYCKKIVNTAPQAGLNALARQNNLQHAFKVRSLRYQHVTLIDDLLTTGSTANALARVLKQQGVERVDLWCCARVSMN